MNEFAKKIFGDVSNKLWNDWHWQLENRIVDLKRIGIGKTVSGRFAVTPHYLNLIEKFDKSDPIYRQVIPFDTEFESNLRIDPFNEESHMPVDGLIVRYPDRGLVVSTNSCYSYCRFCTRKWKWDELNEQLTLNKFDKIIKYLEINPQIRELIFSGGDVLTLSDKTIEKLFTAIGSVGSIKVVRVATRVPAFLPQRITEKFVAIIQKFSPIWIIMHFNHPWEINSESLKAIEKLRFSGASLLSQSVLLKGVNDDYNILYALFSQLQQAGVKPYYLFSCDPVYGTEKFKVAEKIGIELIEKLRSHLGGVAIPQFVADVPGKSKIHIAPLSKFEY